MGQKKDSNMVLKKKGSSILVEMASPAFARGGRVAGRRLRVDDGRD
jgi:hypothetical protein